MHHHVTRLLPYTPDQLFRLIGDVERYPEFVPWITSMRTWNARDSSGMNRGTLMWTSGGIGDELGDGGVDEWRDG